MRSSVVRPTYTRSVSEPPPGTQPRPGTTSTGAARTTESRSSSESTATSEQSRIDAETQADKAKHEAATKIQAAVRGRQERQRFQALQSKHPHPGNKTHTETVHSKGTHAPEPDAASPHTTTVHSHEEGQPPPHRSGSTQVQQPQQASHASAMPGPERPVVQGHVIPQQQYAAPGYAPGYGPGYAPGYGGGYAPQGMDLLNSGLQLGGSMLQTGIAAMSAADQVRQAAVAAALKHEAGEQANYGLIEGQAAAAMVRSDKISDKMNSM